MWLNNFLSSMSGDSAKRISNIEKKIDRLEIELNNARKAAPEASAKAVLAKLDEEYKKHPGRWPRIKKITDDALKQAGISGGVMLEIGGRQNPRNNDFTSFSYFALDLEEQPDSPVAVEVGDITKCPHIPDNTYDFIFSLDVFEHINRPWLAGQEIARILKPGGVTVHSTLFSWRYHPCPGDYFRYTPEGLAELFPELECIHKSFDYTERRRNIIGKDSNRMKPDSIGGWRENVRVNYAGIKPR